MAAPETLSDEISLDIADAIKSFEMRFIWNGRGYDCMIDLSNHALMVAKSAFGPRGQRKYPRRGDTIQIEGSKYQVKSLTDSTLSAVAGGFVQDKPFTDDPNAPALLIGFDTFVKR